MKCLYFCLCWCYVIHLTYSIYNPEDLTVKPLTNKKTTWRKPAMTPQEVEMHHGYSRVQRISPQPGANNQPTKNSQPPINRQPKIDPSWNPNYGLLENGTLEPLEKDREPLEDDREHLEKRPEQQKIKETTTEFLRFGGIEKLDLVEEKKDPIVRIGSRNRLDEEVIQIDDKLAPLEDPVVIHDKLDPLTPSSSEVQERKLNFTPSTGLSNIPLPEGEINVFGFHYPPREYEVYPFPKVPKPYSNMAFEKCPKMVTGQLVYFWSCSQYLNCHKGRGFISNCAPGTLFNPETLECDFPEKVSCITGTHNQQVRSEKLIAAPSENGAKCPKDFAGLLEHPNDCTKFLNCNSGSTYVQTCGPGTVFNPKISACDHPRNSECNLKPSDVPEVDENAFNFDLRSTPDKKPSGNPTLPTLRDVQRNYYPSSNYDLVVGESRYGTRQFNSSGNYRASKPAQYTQAPCQGCQNGNPQIGSSGLRNQPGQGSQGPCQSGCQRSENPTAYTQSQGCQSGCTSGNPTQGSGNSHGNLQGYGISRSPGPFDTSSFGQTGLTNCQGPACTSGTSNFQRVMTQTQTSGKTNINCPPLEVLQGAASGVSSQYIASGTQNRQFSGNVESSGSIKCPSGMTGLVAHPFICEKYLNCANGRTHVQDCGPGTVFNPKIQACDWPRNVNCKSQRGGVSSNYRSSGGQASGREREVEFTSQTGASSQQQLNYANIPQECWQGMYPGPVQKGATFSGYTSRGHGKTQPIPTWVPLTPSTSGQASRGYPRIYTSGRGYQGFTHHVQTPIATTPRTTYSMTHSVSSSRGPIPTYTNGHSFGTGQPMGPHTSFSIVPSIPVYEGHFITSGTKVPVRPGSQQKVPLPFGGQPNCQGCPGRGYGCEACPQGSFPQPQGRPTFGSQPNCQGCPQRGYGCEGCPGIGSQGVSEGQQKVPIHFGTGQNCQGCPQRGYGCEGCPGIGPQGVPEGQEKIPIHFGTGQNCQGCPQRGYGCEGCPGIGSQHIPEGQEKVPVYFGRGQQPPKGYGTQEPNCQGCPQRGYGCEGCPRTPPTSQGGTSYGQRPQFGSRGQPNCQGCPGKGQAQCQGCPTEVPIYFGSGSPSPKGGEPGSQGFGGQPNCQGCPGKGQSQCQGCPTEVPIYFGSGSPSPKGGEPGSQGFGGQPNCQGCPGKGQAQCQGCPTEVPIYFGSGSPSPKGGEPGFESFGGQPNCQGCPGKGHAQCQGCPTEVPIYFGSGSPSPKGFEPGLTPGFGGQPQNCQGCPQRGYGCEGCPGSFTPPEDGISTFVIKIPADSQGFGGQPQNCQGCPGKGEASCRGCPTGNPVPKGFDSYPAGSEVDHHKVPFGPGSDFPNGSDGPKPSVDYEDFEGMGKIPIDYYPETTTQRWNNPTYVHSTPNLGPSIYVKPQTGLQPPNLPPENRTIYIRPSIPNIQTHNSGNRDSFPSYSHTNPHTPVYLQPDNPTEPRFAPLTTTPKSSVHVQRIPPRGTNSTSTVPNWPPPFPKTDIEADYNFEDNPTTYKPSGSTQKYWKTSKFCGDDQFECGIRDCIPRNWVCNGVQDCPNGADEKNCSIYLTHFTLIPNSRLFKHELEKWLNTDLDTCSNYCMNSKGFQCKSFNYRRDDKVCLLCDTNVGLSGALAPSPQYDYYELKDFTVDCKDRYECSNKKCIDYNQVCDGNNDCGDRQDEKNCDPVTIGYEIRLAGSHNPNEGRIEIKVFDEWGYICDDQFGLRDAHVACKELGYHLGALEVKTSSWFATEIKDNDTFYLMDDVECLGNETSLRDCDFNGWGVHNCMPQEIVGVICKTPQEKCPENEWQCDTGKECLPVEYVCDGVLDCEDGSDEGAQHCDAPIEVRLVNGSSKMEGRVEIKYHGMWGTICDDDFNDMAAKVICRSLGYYGSAIAKKDGAYGPGIGPIWLDQVNCMGNESFVQECTHWHWGEHNCDHKEDAAVICSKSEDAFLEKKSRDHSEIDLESINTIPTSEALHPIKCGYRNEDVRDETSKDYSFRVVSGSSAKKGEYPWQATIRVKGKTKSAHWCGAVIISNKFLLTAAHCLVGFAKGAYFIRAGDYDVDTQEGTEQEAFIEDFFIHELFRQGGHMNNDVALIKLKGIGLKMNKHIQPICLPEKDTVYRDGMNCTISGFGSTQTGKSTSSRILRAGWVPIQKPDICKLESVYGKAITDGMICAGSLDEGVDSCDGDSGGPLACLDKGLFTLYGITSWGQHCGHANKPGVYVKVAYYRDWIDKKIEENS